MSRDPEIISAVRITLLHAVNEISTNSLFIYCLTTLLAIATPVTQCRMVGLQNNEFEMMSKEVVVAQFEVLFRYFHKGDENNHEKLSGSPA
jgi:hypothetical protein